MLCLAHILKSMKVVWVLNATKLTELAQKIVILWHLVVESSATCCSCSWC